MRTTGVDLSSQPIRTASCTIHWANGRAKVTDLLPSNVDDDTVTALITASDKVGIDVPLGWPQAFVTAVAAHHEGRAWSGGSLHDLRFRDTDRHVANETGHWPLSVSSDRIAVPAFRAARLLGQLPFTVDRTGAGTVVEAYPAAALRRWGFAGQGYKGKGGIDIRRALVEGFTAATTGWLHVTDAQVEMCKHSDDAFDALIAALVARAAMVGRCDPVPAERRSIIAREGWIALPQPESLHRLT